ncbi:DUF1254 domain-containing protein [Bdellovibrio sp. HCB337]|uniref:DUF1254 domain-containing protein n=1 Tax=Bdellovibrio sp. HCB337 TaxID=3394358 RepID=UPI0039A6F675
MYSRSLLVSSIILAVTLGACASKERKEAEAKAKAQQQQVEAAQAQLDAEKKLFTQLKPQELDVLVQEAVVYGYPLVLMDATRDIQQNPNSEFMVKSGPNEFYHVRNFPDVNNTGVVSSNVDTLYSSGWLDLSREPVVLSLPAAGNRYYMMTVLDAWTNVISSPGTRTTGSAQGDFVIVGPNWQGQTPANLRKIQSPTNMVWVVGRTATTGGKDFETVHAIQNRYKLTPLSRFDRSVSAPAVTASVAYEDKNFDGSIPPPQYVAGMDAARFFGRLSHLMVANPPAAGDRTMVERLARIGVKPGQTVDYAKLPEDIRRSLDTSVKNGLKRVDQLGRQPQGRMLNGWVFATDWGQYGTDYETRASVARLALGANRAEDAVYPRATVDTEGNKLNGSNKYTINFAKNNKPPVNAFWSLTMYDARQYFVPNTLNRYSLGDRSNLKANKDGSVTIYIQPDNPGKSKVSNWLPSPRGDFNVMMRLYWPKQAILDGEWRVPGIQRVHPPQRLTKKMARRLSKR